ncbi:Methionine aminopeptidase 1D, mitochondrial [Globomyces sp. JEL0801]|nr:Methionine aminopeptidase 1D, mitochondrial [Globomyces sp. JEL0801]
MLAIGRRFIRGQSNSRIRGSLKSPKERESQFGNYELILPDLMHLGRPTEQLHVPSSIIKPDYSNLLPVDPHGDIPILTKEDEIQPLRDACGIARDALQLAVDNCKLGMTTNELDKLVHQYIISKNAYPSPLNYSGFPKSICTSINNVLCHGIPDNRQLKNGDVINIDITVYYNGFHGDTSRTIIIGEGDIQAHQLVNHTKNALDMAISMIKPGLAFCDIGCTIDGHGIGRRFHQPPLILHYANNEKGVIAEGMVFTVEPILCQGGPGFVKWPDDWTVVSKDGGRSSQFEHTIMVTSSGVDVLTNYE